MATLWAVIRLRNHTRDLSPLVRPIVFTVMAGHHGPTYSAKAGPVPFPKLPGKQVIIAKTLGFTMWFWIFYRIKQDGPVMFGFKKPWEH